MDSNDTNIDFFPEIGSPAQLRPANWSDDMSMRSKTVKVDQGDLNRWVRAMAPHLNVITTL